jgi:eukaryotic-like serine/threonine-protein kinase
MSNPSSLSGLFAERYLIEREIGRGGMANVYLARDTRQQRLVAVKVLRSELSQALVNERFQREIAITANLTHPHILPLHDSGEWEGRLFYVMPYLEGETLRARLDRERQLPLREAVCIARGVASALEHAHKHRVVHRDVKPENILIVDGQPVVVDFGIARAVQLSEEERLTLTGISMGTPAYMSPEQASGDRSIDARSDIYSLGCVLYEMLAGEPPFAGPNAHAIIVKRLSEPAPDVRYTRETVPAILADVVARALAAAPADRVQTAAEMERALDAAEIECSTAAVRRQTPRRPTVSRLLDRRSTQLALSVVGVLAVMTIGWMRFGQFTAANRGRAGGSAIHTLAVLPLASISGGTGSSMGGMGAQDFFADGMTDALITGLAQIRNLNVISRTSVMQYKMMKKPLPQIARELHADAVLEGSVVRSGDKVRITAKLIRAADDGALWARSYERQIGDALGLQDDIAQSVAEEIGAKLVAAPAVSAGRRAIKPEAQEAYLKGSYFAGQWRLPEAIASFQQAVAIDPNHAPAYAGLARAYYFRAFFGEVAPAEAFSQMRRAAARALERDETSAEAHGLMALVNTHYDWDWQAAERHFARALVLSPSDAQVHHDYAHLLLALGRGQESAAETKRARELDPANPMLTSCAGWHSLFDSQFDSALLFAKEAQQMMPSFWAQVVTGWAYLGKGERDSAVVALRKAVVLSGSLPFARASLAHALAKQGKTTEAREILSGLLHQSLRGYVSAYDIAVVYAGLGENDRALEWLRKAIGERSVFVVHMAWDSRLDGLRVDPRFAELVGQLNLPSSHRAPALPST